MTREEEIFEVAERHSEYEYDETTYSNGFIDGAKWADANPKSLWISVKDRLPKQDEEVIALCDDLNIDQFYKISFAHIVDKTMCQDYNGWNIPNVVYWFPMPKLPKKQEINL